MDIVGEWRISEDNEQRLKYPAIRLDSDSVFTLFSNLDSINTGKFCTCDGELSLRLNNVHENLDIIHISNDTLILSGFSFNLVKGDYKYNDTVTYIRVEQNKK